MAQNRLSDKARDRGRMAIYAMAGLYLLYMAYSIFNGLSSSSGNERILMIVFIIFFTIVGGGMVIMGVYMGYRLSKQTPDATKEIEEETEEEKEASTEEEKESE